MQPVKLDDKRDANGNPNGLKRLRDRFKRRFGNAIFRISGNEEQVTAGDVDQSQHYNDLIPWFVLLSLVAGAALALTIEDRMGRQQELEWAMRTARAETENKMAPTIAKLQTDMEQAVKNADLARDFVDRKNAELKQLAESKRK
jgi:hypothetical protein